MINDLTPITDAVVRDLLNPYNHVIYSLIQMVILILCGVFYVKLIRKKFFKEKIYKYKSIVYEKKSNSIKKDSKASSEKRKLKYKKKQNKLDKWYNSSDKKTALILTSICVLFFTNMILFNYGVYSKISGEKEWKVETTTVETIATYVNVPEDEKGQKHYSDAEIEYYVFFTDYPDQFLALHDEDFFEKGKKVYVVTDMDNNLLGYFNSDKYTLTKGE